MGLRDRLEKKATELGEGMLTAAPEYVQRAEDGYRGFRAMWEDDGRPVTIEAFLLTLVRAVRDDDPDDYRSQRDLYCETATLCDVASFHDLALGDEHVSAHMLVLWGIADDLSGDAG